MHQMSCRPKIRITERIMNLCSILCQIEIKYLVKIFIFVIIQKN